MLRTTLVTSLLAATLHAAPARAEAPLEVIVVADPFARWDDTRWGVQTRVSLAYPVPLYAARNKELWITAYDLRLALHCSLGEAMNRRVREAVCDVEDAALTAVPWRRPVANDPAVVDDVVTRLEGIDLVLKVADDGRVTQLTIRGEPEINRRINIAYENIRQLVRRAIVGFHMQVPDDIPVGEQWYEKHSELFGLPAFRYLPAGWGDGVLDGTAYLQLLGQSSAEFGAPSEPGVSVDGASSVASQRPAFPDGVRTPGLVGQARHPLDVLQAAASYGYSLLGHRVDRYQDQYVIQSHGEGSMDIGADDATMSFTGTVDAVGVFDPVDGILTERVWTVKMVPRASSMLAEGVAGYPYEHLGRLRKLGADEPFDVGTSGIVQDAPRGRGHVSP